MIDFVASWYSFLNSADYHVSSQKRKKISNTLANLRKLMQEITKCLCLLMIHI